MYIYCVCQSIVRCICYAVLCVLGRICDIKSEHYQNPRHMYETFSEINTVASTTKQGASKDKYINK